MKPWLWLSPKLAHDLGPLGLKVWSQFLPSQNVSWRPFDWRGLHFRNRLGIAGGVDKTGDSLIAWQSFGCGFLELGTVTPKPQTPNPGVIIDRDSKQQIVWNKMGFPGPGADLIAHKLSSIEKPNCPLFINIGKNRVTSNEDAAADYVTCIKKLTPFADAFVVNISSPNTSGLRDLGQKDILKSLLQILPRQKPLLLKLSPDLSERELYETLEQDVDGWILTNTTTAREPNSQFSKEGGVSGKPLAKMSKQKLQQAVKFLANSRRDRLVISVGGIMTPDDVKERLELGADLVQVYSTLIFAGPLFFRATAKYFDKDPGNI